MAMFDFAKKWIPVPTEREKQHLNPLLFKNILLKTTILPIALMILLSIIFVQQITFLIDQNEKVRNSDQMLALSTLAVKKMIDTESGFRGFMITGKETFLNPWYESKRELTPVLKELKELNSDNRGQLELLDHIEEVYQKWSASVSIEIRSKREGKAVPNVGSFEESKALMDDIRQSFDQFQQTENSYRLDRLERADNLSKVVIGGTVILGLILGILLATFSLFQLRGLSENYSEAFNSLAEATDKLEEQIDTRTRELQTVNRELEAVNYSISHDLRAPLRGIDGFSQILIDDYGNKLDNEAVRYLSFIKQGVQKMGILIDDLIKLSRLTRSEFKKEEIDISIVADELIKELTVPNPDRKVQFKNFESEMIQADPGLLRVALQNLINNAWKYTSTRDLTIIECGKTHKDGQWAYFIRDNGVGFDMRFYDKLFQPFQRLHPKDKFEGTGMGLATTARIIRRHGGVIWAESVVGEGSTFYFTLDVK